ncbi:HTH-type transcriptional regulator / antitoxin HipB [Pedococcus cremeus]|uniref:HTH-type transcriptional regulator / antitoxin HipB n=1 Tax=Pedococcus cremeus TaxID=587636 RepID=A0A1H9XQS5_9MICO|nr:helix-turn-helix transcriptional regulator [Pedococcus cremeus]SES48515.1 HTH-type transcriptional regulator / antitoxin HipB [Pedococcus cremeus]
MGEQQWDEQQWDEKQWDDVGLDIAGYVARVRRIADLSQRELAQRLGVGPATVGRWESGGSMAVDVLERVLGLAGLRLQVVDESGRVVPPFGSDAVRDNAGRRFPAHLDVVPPDRWPLNRGAGPRYDRADPQGWYALRSTRDGAGATGAQRPVDHPTVEQLAQRSAARRGRRARVLEPLPECGCPDTCFEQPACAAGCRCRCESPCSGLSGGRPLE